MTSVDPLSLSTAGESARAQHHLPILRISFSNPTLNPIPEPITTEQICNRKKKLTFTNSTGEQGAAIIAVWFADITVEDSLFEALTTQLDGGAVYMTIGANLSVARSTFRNCTGQNAAIAIVGGVGGGDDFIDVEMVDTLFEFNGGPLGEGGAINTALSSSSPNMNA